jgi:hypothetical protein
MQRTRSTPQQDHELKITTDHHIPWPIAILLDPMVALTLTTVLYADARLAAWGIPPPRWSTALRWSSGLAATLMNTWTSLWPDDHIGWPRHANPAGVLLHSVPPLLLIGLTETIASYRRCTSHLHPHPHPHPATAPPQQVHPHPAAAPLREQNGSTPGAPAPAIRPPAGTPHPAPHPKPALHPIPHPGTHPHPHPHPTGDRPQETPARPDGPHPAPNAPAPRPGADSRADAELYAQALALDAAATCACLLSAPQRSPDQQEGRNGDQGKPREDHDCPDDDQDHPNQDQDRPDGEKKHREDSHSSRLLSPFPTLVSFCPYCKHFRVNPSVYRLGDARLRDPAHSRPGRSTGLTWADSERARVLRSRCRAAQKYSNHGDHSRPSEALAAP